MNKLPISLVIITLNEESNIARCLDSAPFVNEIILVDSGSQDKTLEIVKKYNSARVNVEPWLGYAKQKIKATSYAKNEWVLSLDADEALSPEAAAEIEQLFKSDLKFDAYKMPRKNWYGGRWMRFAGMYPDYQTRLFLKDKAHWTPTQVHEHVVANSVGVLKSPILHWSFKSVAHQIETINKYSTLRALDFKNSGKKFSSLKMFLKTISKFIETFILKQGFRDGRQGLMVSMVSAFATFLRWAKLNELETQERNSQK